MSQQQRRLIADRTRLSRQGRQIHKEVSSGRVQKSRSRDRLTIIPTPLASRPSGSTESRGTSLVLASSRLEVPEPILIESGQPQRMTALTNKMGSMRITMARVRNLRWVRGSVRYEASGAPKNAGPQPNSPPRPAERPGAGRVFLAFPAPAPGPGRSPDGSMLKQVGGNGALSSE